LYEVKIASPSTWDPSKNKKIFRVMAETRVRRIGNGCYIEAPCSPLEADYGECARPVEFPEGNPIQRGELEHFQEGTAARLGSFLLAEHIWDTTV
jgi:hypothetical protein